MRLVSARSTNSSPWRRAPYTWALHRKLLWMMASGTSWDADAETKVYWRSPDGNAPRTTVIPRRGVQMFQTLGEFKLEAVG